MSFIRHVGKIGDRKAAVVFRQIPGEDHMCLVVYTETLNAHIHDPLMQCIESDIGQNSENLADALNRTHTRDGKMILQVLHHEGLLKKIQTSQVLMTPTPTTKIRLDELNKILTEMQLGEAAVKRLAEIDQSAGLQDPADVARRMRVAKEAQSKMTSTPGALGDSELANSLRQQAMKMASEAKGLLAESDRLLKEASQLEGVKPETTKPKSTRSKKAVTT